MSGFATLLQLGLGLDHLSEVFVRHQLVILVSEREVRGWLLDLEVCYKLFYDVDHHQGGVYPDFDDAILGGNTICRDQCFV